MCSLLVCCFQNLSYRNKTRKLAFDKRNVQFIVTNLNSFALLFGAVDRFFLILKRQ